MECEQRAARVWPGRLSTPPPAPRMCGVCRLHGDLVPRRGHDPCPLKHCRCSLCDVRRKRLLQKKQREHLGEDQSRERGEEQDEVQGEEQGEESGEEQVERNSEVQDEEQGEQHGEQQREEPGESVGEEQGEEQGEHQEKRQGDQRGLAKKCSLCLQHGTEVLRKGHKACPFENCPCAGCCYVRKRRLSQRKEERKTAHLTSSWSKLQDERQAEQQRGEPAEDQGEEQGEEQGEQHAQQQTGQHDEGQDKTQGEERGEQNGEQQEKQQREEPGEGEDEVQEEEQGGQQAEQQLEEPDKRESEEQGKEQGEQQGKRQEEQRRLVQKCLLCLKHGKEVRWKGHKSCPFENCPCAGCSLVRHRRLLRRKPRPYHKSAPLPNGLNEPQGDQWVKKPGKQHAEHQDKQQAEQEDTQQRKQQRKQRRKQQRKQWGRRSTRKCNLCLKHGNVVSWKGHRDSCPFQSCPCAGCCLVRCRRILGRKRALLSRKSHSHASAAISSPAPGAAAPPVPSSHAFEVFFERAAKMTGENRRREAERLASAVDILCWDKENIEQRNRSATQARSSQRLRRIHLGQTTTSNRIPSIPIGNSDDRLQRGKKRCLLCREHGKLVFTSGHKQCPYEHCPCLRCRTVRRHRLLDKIVHSRKRRLQYTRSGPARKLRARRLADQAAVAAAAAGHSGSAGDGHWAPTEPEAESGDIQSRSPVIFSAYKATRTAWRVRTSPQGPAAEGSGDESGSKKSKKKNPFVLVRACCSRCRAHGEHSSAENHNCAYGACRCARCAACCTEATEETVILQVDVVVGSASTSIVLSPARAEDVADPSPCCDLASSEDRISVPGLGSVLTRRLRKLRHKADDMPPPTLELSHDEEAGDEDPTNAFVRALRSWAARKMGASACSATAAAAGGDAEEEKPSACARCGDMVDPGAARRGAHVCRDVEDAGPAGARLAESLVFRMTVCMQCDTAVEWDKLCRCFQADGDELEPPCGELVEADEHGAGDMPRLSPQDTPSAAYKTRSSHHADEDKDGPALSRKIAEHKTYQNKKPMSNVMNAVENELHSNPPLQTRLSGIRALAKEQKTEPAPIASLATDYVKVEYLVSPTKGLQTEEPVLSKAPQTVAVRSEPSRLKTEPVATPPCVVIDDDDEETDEPVLIEAPLTHADKMKRPLLETGRAPSPPCMVIVDDEEEVAPQQRSSAPADLRGRKSATVDDSAQSCLLCLLSAESGADATGLTTDLLDAHMGDVHGGVAGDAFCSSCLRRFRDEATLRAHMSRSHPGGPSGLAAPAPALSFSCSSCGFWCGDRATLRTHQEVYHLGLVPLARLQDLAALLLGLRLGKEDLQPQLGERVSPQAPAPQALCAECWRHGQHAARDHRPCAYSLCQCDLCVRRNPNNGPVKRRVFSVGDETLEE